MTFKNICIFLPAVFLIFFKKTSLLFLTCSQFLRGYSRYEWPVFLGSATDLEIEKRSLFPGGAWEVILALPLFYE